MKTEKDKIRNKLRNKQDSTLLKLLTQLSLNVHKLKHKRFIK